MSTHMFLGDGTDVVDVFDLPLVLHHPHGDGVLADLGGDVAFDPKAQVPEHQIPWPEKNTDGGRGSSGGEDVPEERTCGDAVEEREHPDGSALISGDGGVDPVGLLYSGFSGRNRRWRQRGSRTA